MQPVLPVKWKIFRIANYLQILGVTSTGIYIIYMMSFGISISSLIPLLLSFICIGVLLANAGINLNLLEYYYRGKQPATWLSITSAIILILSGIIIIFLFLPLYYSYNALFFAKSLSALLDILWMLVLLTIIVTGIYICRFQVVLRKMLKKNQQLVVDNFLNTGEMN